MFTSTLSFGPLILGVTDPFAAQDLLRALGLLPHPAA